MDMKIRIYDKNNSVDKMLYPKIEWFDDMLGFRFSHFDSKPEDLIVMQSTGHIDRNGVEIYEGDILESDYKQFRDDKKDYEGDLLVVKKSPVYGYLSHFVLDFCGVVNNVQTLDHARLHKVIGNIYENPELVRKVEK